MSAEMSGIKEGGEGEWNVAWPSTSTGGPQVGGVILQVAGVFLGRPSATVGGPKFPGVILKVAGEILGWPSTGTGAPGVASLIKGGRQEGTENS